MLTSSPLLFHLPHLLFPLFSLRLPLTLTDKRIYSHLAIRLMIVTSVSVGVRIEGFLVLELPEIDDPELKRIVFTHKSALKSQTSISDPHGDRDEELCQACTCR